MSAVAPVADDQELDTLEGYVEGLGRDIPAPRRSHLYKGTFNDPGLPMCRYGWNRDDGTAYSIFRGNRGDDGLCKICLKRATAGLDGVKAGGES